MPIWPETPTSHEVIKDLLTAEATLTAYDPIAIGRYRVRIGGIAQAAAGKPAPPSRQNHCSCPGILPLVCARKSRFNHALIPWGDRLGTLSAAVWTAKEV